MCAELGIFAELCAATTLCLAPRPRRSISRPIRGMTKLLTKMCINVVNGRRILRPDNCNPNSAISVQKHLLLAYAHLQTAELIILSQRSRNDLWSGMQM